MFIVDFGRVVPAYEDVQVVTRVVMTPVHVMQLLRALTENVASHETASARSRKVSGPAHRLAAPGWVASGNPSTGLLQKARSIQERGDGMTDHAIPGSDQTGTGSERGAFEAGLAPEH